MFMATTTVHFFGRRISPYEGNQAVAVGDLVGSSKGRASLILGMGKNPGLPVLVKWGMVLAPIFGVLALFGWFHRISTLDMSFYCIITYKAS